MLPSRPTSLSTGPRGVERRSAFTLVVSRTGNIFSASNRIPRRFVSGQKMSPSCRHSGSSPESMPRPKPTMR
eukprot:797406-Prymnesium_polylepis.1